MLRNDDETGALASSYAQCPGCGGSNLKHATKCIHCSIDLLPGWQTNNSTKQFHKDAKFWIIGAVILVIGSAGIVIFKDAPSIADQYQTSNEDVVIGRWCDVMVPHNQKFKQVIMIIKKASSKLIAKTEFYDGSKRTLELSETPGGFLLIDGSSQGDKFRIVDVNGELRILDDDGFIRSATRLENTPEPGDCL